MIYNPRTFLKDWVLRNFNPAKTRNYSPALTAVNQAGTKVYLIGNGIFSVINTATNTVADTTNVGGAPQGVAVTPDGKKAYVTDPANNRIDVIDTATNNITATLNVNVWPIGVAVNPAGTKAYVTNLRSSTISVVDIATNSFTAWVNVGYHPRGVTVTPDGAKAFVTNTDNETVSVIDTATNTVINTVNVGTNPFGVAVTPDGSKVYVANNGDGTVSIINTTTNTVTDTINVGGTPFAFGQFIGPGPAQQILPVANFTSNVTGGYASLSVQFTDKSIGSPTSWSWDFNNDGIDDSKEKNSTYTYANPGTYVSKLTVSNANGFDSKTATITVLETSSSNGKGSDGGSSHSSGNGNSEGKAIVVRGSNASNSTDNTNAVGTIMQSENNTQSFGQNDGIAEANVEQTPEQKKAATTPAKESKKTRGFEIIYGVVSLLAAFCINERKSN
jgi:YVTN family beta-propeller protein